MPEFPTCPFRRAGDSRANISRSHRWPYPSGASSAQTLFVERCDGVLRAHLRSHLDEFTGPVLLITHDPLEAMIMADRLLVIENGRVVQQGTPAQVARQPATQYVARLVGLNLYAGTLEIATRRASLDVGGTFTATLGDDPVESALAGQSSVRRVLVGLRPSAITIHTTQPTQASPRNVWNGTVVALELLTDRVRVQVDATPPALADISAAAVADLALRPGTPCGSQPKPLRRRPTPTPASTTSRESPGTPIH